MQYWLVASLVLQKNHRPNPFSHIEPEVIRTLYLEEKPKAWAPSCWCLTVLSTVGSTDDRRDTASWPCQWEGVSEAVRGVTDRDSGANAAASFLGTCQGHSRWPRDHERVEVEPDLKILAQKWNSSRESSEHWVNRHGRAEWQGNFLVQMRPTEGT